MAAVLGANVTKYDAGALGSNWIDSTDVKTGTSIFFDTYEASSLASGSTITMATLPSGAKVLDIKVWFDALGGSSTLKVGDSTDDDRYYAAAASSSAGVFTDILIDGVGYVIGTNSGDDDIIITTGGASITGTIKMLVTYSV